MREILTSLQAGDFLQDFENRATVEIIEGAKEKNEIIKIAKAKGTYDLGLRTVWDDVSSVDISDTIKLTIEESLF